MHSLTFLVCFDALRKSLACPSALGAHRERANQVYQRARSLIAAGKKNLSFK